MSKVYQQPFHLEDDTHFAMHLDYSFKWSLETIKPLMRRWLEENSTRYHVPIAICIHPQNRIFSGKHFEYLTGLCREIQVPIMNFETWLDFCETRRNWNADSLSFEDACLTIKLPARTHDKLSLLIPKIIRENKFNLSALKVNHYPIRTFNVMEKIFPYFH